METSKLALSVSAKYGLNANTLKVIAIITMFFDHFSAVFFPHDTIWGVLLRIPGRLSAPIMCYMIAEGYHHTSNLKRYILRLMVFAVISHIPYNLCFNYSFLQATSVIWGLAMGLIALAIVKKEEWNVLLRLIGLGLCCLLSVNANWNYIAVLWILGFGIFHGQRGKSLMAFVVVAGIYLIQPWIHGTYFPFISRFGVFLVTPLLLLYNGERGRKSKLIKWGFYWFYPIHLLIIYWIGQLI